MPDLGKAYVQIIPKAEGISGKVEQAIGGGNVGMSAGAKIASGLKKAFTVAAIGAPIIAGFKAAIDEGAKLEQSFGGLDTIYGKASGAAKKYAMDAAQAGISANSYAEQAVSFGASLKQAFEGDTSKAVKAANTAILDMTDNAAKMGTPIENIQNAYQGFAKQNYTMLDNLKLGYGGTKTEMERLLADASKLSGKKYDIGNLGDVYDAIHVIQQDLGLTGVAAEEASNTFSGSFAAMKASAANLGAVLANGGDIGPAMKSLATNAGNFLFKNLIPMVGRIIAQLPSLIVGGIKTAGPAIMSAGSNLIAQLNNGITSNLSTFTNRGTAIVTDFASKFMASVPTIMEKGSQLILSLHSGVMSAIPQIYQAAANLVTKIGEAVSKGLPGIGEKGGKVAENLVSGLIKNLGKYLPKIIIAAGKLGLAMVKALIKIVPRMALVSLQISKGIVKGLGGGALSLIRGAMNKIGDAMRKPIEKARTTIKKIMDKIKHIFPLKVGKVLSNLRLPTINVSAGSPPFGIGGKGKKPSFSVSWNAKGNIFDGPTIAGLGEAGREAIVPLEGRYMRPFAKTIADEMGGAGSVTNFYITVDGTENPEAFADRLVSQLKFRTRMA